MRYGGNTSCVELQALADTRVVLDAGTGIRRLGAGLPPEVCRVDVLLTHLHMDHIQGLGFFAPLFRRDFEVHIWGPGSATADLRTRLTRYMAPPLFPVRLSELECDLHLHDLNEGCVEVPGFTVRAALVCHPGPTVGYRIEGEHGNWRSCPITNRSWPVTASPTCPNGVQGSKSQLESMSYSTTRSTPTPNIKNASGGDTAP